MRIEELNEEIKQYKKDETKLPEKQGAFSFSKICHINSIKEKWRTS